MGASLQAVLVRLPVAHILKQRISAVTSGHFIKKTKIIQELAGEEKEALGVVASVDDALSNFRPQKHPQGPFEKNRNVVIAKHMLMNRPCIIKSILQDYPEAIQELQDKGLLEE